MHEGCSGSFTDGKAAVDKLRLMGFNNQPMPAPMAVECRGCGKPFTMETFEAACPDCRMVHGVTPCHAFDRANVMAAGVGY